MSVKQTKVTKLCKNDNSSEVSEQKPIEKL